MDQKDFLNVFHGPNAVAKFYNPDLQTPLPLVEIPDSLNPFRQDGVKIFAKLMTALPAHNVKSLPALNMLLSKGIPPSTKTIVEQSSGSTVISLSIIARIFHGIDDVRAYITNKTSLSRMNMLRFFGLQLVLYGGPHQPEPLDPRGGIAKARNLSEQDNNVVNPNQYENHLNPDSHVRWTGPQILRQLPGINVLCAPMGTGGVITGTGGFLKSSKREILVVGVCNANGDPVPGPRPFQLFESVKFPWKNVVDAIEHISSNDSYYLSMRLSREGLICGPSSGMTLKGLYNFLEKEKDRGRLPHLAGPDGTVSCVFMCCDLPYQYLDDYFTKLGDDHFRPIVNENLIHADTYLYDTKWEVEYWGAAGILSRTLGKPSLMANGHDKQNNMPNDSETFWKTAPAPIPILLDLRCPPDFADSHIPTAINVPLRSLNKSDRSPYEDSDILEAQWLELEGLFGGVDANKEKWRDFEGRPVVLVCYSGDTARVATSVLRARGIEAVSIKGGMEKVMREIFASDLPETGPARSY